MSRAIAAAPSQSRSRCWSRNAGCPPCTRSPSHTPSPRTNPASKTDTTASARGTSAPLTWIRTSEFRGSSAKSCAPWAVWLTDRSGELGVVRRLGRGLSVVGAGLLEPGEGRLDLPPRLRAADPVRALDRLPGLDVLVDHEEVLDLEPVELRQVVDVTHVLEPGVGGGHAEHLVVAALLVGHPVHPDRPALDQAPRERRLAEEQY